MSAPLKERHTRACALQRRGRRQGADESVLLASWGIAALAACEQALSSPAARRGRLQACLDWLLAVAEGAQGAVGSRETRTQYGCDPRLASDSTPGCGAGGVSKRVSIDRLLLQKGLRRVIGNRKARTQCGSNRCLGSDYHPQ